MFASAQYYNFVIFVPPSGGAVGQVNAEWFRAQAAECLARAEKATDPRIKAYEQSEAERWLKLVDLAEKQDQGPTGTKS